MANTIEPFQYEVDPVTGCWNWKLSRDRKGYGRTSRNGKKAKAHRLSYELKFGQIPDGMHIDHLCSNPSCVNPDHLEPVTPAENVRRQSTTKLDWNSVNLIRKLCASTPQKSIAEMFGVTVSCISDINRNDTWKPQ